ncbi:hypothetical protein LTR37_007381 [Vermiconidia calcicola]|uniref:Uncharacterized protein n=1 Tax=Vermiconidia calcicola TaxID=1690605 RepID=A0ACC3NDS6_9PEZI|nr:hypothetical protein LTR37_007381 [Vermiconidia calcicola]
MDMGDNSRNGLYDALWCGVDHSPIGQLQPYRSLLESILVDLHQGLVLPRHESIEPYFRSFERGHRFLLCCLPMLMLRHFDIDRRKKIALNAVFSLGLLVVAASAVRTYYLEKLGTATDLTWIGFDVFVWSQLETLPEGRYLAHSSHKLVDHNGIQSDMRESKQPDLATIDSLNTSDGFSEGSDRYMAKHNATPALEPVFEQDLECPRARTPDDLIKTPADFEAYALRNLESARHQTRATPPPRPCQSPAKTLDDRTSPRSWLDDDNSS